MRKRLAALALAAIFTLGAFPFDVSAMTQLPVTDIFLEVRPGLALYNHDLTFHFVRPQEGMPGGGTDMNVEGSLANRATNYYLYWRNATKNAGYLPSGNNNEPNQNNGRIVIAQGDNHSERFDNQKFLITESAETAGNLYNFRVAASHPHVTQDSSGMDVLTYAENLLGKEVVFLSDMWIEAEGTGSKQIKVTFSKPTFSTDNGTPTKFFSGFRISYGMGGSNASFGSFPPVDVPVENLTTNSDGHYTTTIETNITLKTGEVYAVKVEPLVYGTIGADGKLAGAVLASSQTTGITAGGGKLYLYYSSGKEYRYNEVTVTPGLQGTPTENTKLRLYWEESFRSQNIIFDSDSIDDLTLTIYYADNEGMNGKRDLITLNGAQALDRMDIMTERDPGGTKMTTWFQYVFSYLHTTNGERERYYIASNTWAYNPTDVTFYPEKPIIRDANALPANLQPTALSLLWEAFMRGPVTTAELDSVDANKNGVWDKGTEGLVQDRDLTYQIWVTDNVNAVDDRALLPLYEIGGREGGANALIDATWPAQDPDNPSLRTVPAYIFDKITAYSASLANGEYTTLPVTDNRIYYFKVRAVKTVPPDQVFTADAYYSLYVPPINQIDTNPVTVGKPPLTIKKLESGAEDITINSVRVTWDTKWNEVYSDADKAWFSEVGIVDGALVFGKKITDEMRTSEPPKTVTFSDYKGDDAIEAAKARLIALGANEKAVELLPTRTLELNNYEPHIRAIKKTDVDNGIVNGIEIAEAKGGYENYIRYLLSMDEGADAATLLSNWGPQVTPTGDPNRPEYNITGLEENTPYVIIFRPFLAGKPLMAYYPTYVLATTLLRTSPIDVIPTVPTIVDVEEKDVSLEVKWEYKTGYKYELYYSELPDDYPDGAKRVVKTWDEINMNHVIKKGIRPIDGEEADFLHYVVTGLFPNTTYYLWLVAMTETEIENGAVKVNVSSPSNPIMMKTKDLAPPNPPEGLGLIDEEALDIINKENEGQLMPTEYDYLIIQFMKDPNGEELDASTGAFTGGDVEVLSSLSPSLLKYVMAKFNGLIANRTYYIRAKTRLTVTKNTAGGASEPTYQYIVEMSLSPEFTDPMTLWVPPGEAVPDSATSISRESIWTDTYHFMTAPYKGEYDGDKNNNMYPLPVNDFEIIYNAATDSLSVRLRSDKTDAQGNHDNLTDQRFISKLISNNTYNYVLDVTSYNNKAVTNKVIELPYSVINAFDERKINLTVRSGDLTVTFSPGFTQTAEVKRLNAGFSSSLVITFRGNPAAPGLFARESYATAPQKLSLNYVTAKTNLAMQTTANPIAMSFKVQNRYDAYDSNLGVYTALDNNEWGRQTDTYDEVSGMLSSSASKLGTFAAIKVAPPSQTIADPATEQALASVQTKMNIRDVNRVYAQSQISANQLNKIMAALAKNLRDVEINAGVTEAERTSLTKANMFLTSGTTVTRGQAAAALVKLYETKTKSQLKGFSSPIEKAEYLGFFGDDAPRAGDIITFGEALQMVDIIIMDAGI
ncbi:hypothetical protein FACS189490_04560 [Clostridia bacterium]|nr:hypothetical protein FACS189490_04560 [Clostridia bacterium]